MKQILILPLITILLLGISSLRYTASQPWKGTPQQIPGKIQAELYDLGGEDIAYHDDDSTNNGSGNLNPKDGSFLNEFRMQEGVDISYTKSNEIDNNPFNSVEPIMDQLYVGWTVPGEWMNYSVQIAEDGDYRIGIMYTANGDGDISLDLNGKQLTEELFIPSSSNDQDSIEWRHWHHWNRIDSLTTVNLKKGIHTLTLHTVSNGNMNYDYLDFQKIQ